jgi:hypothetical protein
MAFGRMSFPRGVSASRCKLNYDGHPKTLRDNIGSHGMPKLTIDIFDATMRS